MKKEKNKSEKYDSPTDFKLNLTEIMQHQFINENLIELKNLGKGLIDFT